MAESIVERLDDEELDALFALIEEGASQFLDQALERADFIDWFARAAPERGLLPLPGASAEKWYRALGAVLFDALPLPPTFRQGKTARPGRNDPCLCGSGQKYKQCCAGYADEFDFGDTNLLRPVLLSLPPAQMRALVQSQVDTRALAEVVDDWCDDDDFERVAEILAPWFDAETGKFNQASVPLLGALASALLELERDDEAAALIERVLARGDRHLRAEGFRTRAYTRLDKADFDAAWEDFEEVRRLAPSAPDNATLELTILLMSKRYDDARARAQYWLPRLERNTAREADAPLEFVERVLEDPETALDDTQSGGDFPELVILEEMLEEAPPVARGRPAAPNADGELTLTVAPALRRLETRWADVFPVRKPAGAELLTENEDAWEDPEPWLEFLQENPQAWSSIEVLDDLTNLICTTVGIETPDELTEALLSRGAAVVNAQLPTNALPTGHFDWDLRESRAALRLLAREAIHTGSMAPQPMGGPPFIERVERLLVLDPADHFGLVAPLGGALLYQGDTARVLAMPPRPSTDGPGQLNEVLAMRMAGQDEAARRLLVEIEDANAVLLEWLRDGPPSAAPKDPALLRAWGCCNSMRPLWLASGGLDWLGEVLD